MVFGIGEGKIEIKVDKLNYKPGDTIVGTIILDLKQPKKAKRVYLTFFGERYQNRTRFDSRTGRSTTDRVKETIFSFDLALSGEKEYLGKTEYPFELQVPMDLLHGEPLDHPIVNTLRAFGSMTSRPEWFLRAGLAISLGFDITTQLQINIG